jgi:hypothetical protein
MMQEGMIIQGVSGRHTSAFDKYIEEENRLLPFFQSQDAIEKVREALAFA